MRTILECVGEDPDRPGLVNTPERYAKAMMLLTAGYGQNVRDVVNKAIFPESHNEMVIVRDIDIFSMCEHHLLPFAGKIHIGYVPYQAVIGISKLSRLAQLFSRRLQIQERLTKDVANCIMEVLQPQGVAVVIEANHLCMAMRGVEKSTASTITSCMLGCFETRGRGTSSWPWLALLASHDGGWNCCHSQGCWCQLFRIVRKGWGSKAYYYRTRW